MGSVTKKAIITTPWMRITDALVKSQLLWILCLPFISSIDKGTSAIIHLETNHVSPKIKQIIANLSLLLPDDFAAIREFLQRRQGMTSQAKADLSLQLARQIKTIISLEKLPAPFTPEVFLEAVYIAYQSSTNNNNC